MMQQADL